MSLHTCHQSLGAAQGQALMQQLPPAQRFDASLRWDRYVLQVNARQSLERIVALNVPNTMELLVLHEHAGQTDVALRLEQDAKFNDRPLPTPRLQVPLTLKPGQHVLHLGYRIYARGSMEPEILSPREAHWLGTLNNLGMGLMMGILLTLCIGILVYRFVGGPLAYIAYLGLVLSEIGMLMQIEGYSFAYLWPDAPAWNRAITPAFASFVLAFHAVFAASFLQLRMRFRKLWLAHVICVGLAVTHLLWIVLSREYVDVSQSVAMATVLYAVLASITAVAAVRQRLPGSPLYLLGAFSLVVFGFVLFPMGVVGLNPFPFVNFFVYPKIGILLEAGFFCAALVNRVMQFREQQAQQRMRRLAEIEELLHAEEARRLALELAQRQSLQLASASHDIAQPLASLRFAVTALKQKEESGSIAHHLDQTLDYAESLLKDVILRSRSELQQELAHTTPVNLGELMQHVAQSHRQEAAAKGLLLKVVPSDALAEGSSVVIGRILRNLLSNAIRYTPRGRIVLGLRRRAAAWSYRCMTAARASCPRKCAG
ncbi:MAG: hypothetical protein HC858_04440 [Brachymonas sp.]|nr:hypothetical protein [Brachymonas sp.]